MLPHCFSAGSYLVPFLFIPPLIDYVILRRSGAREERGPRYRIRQFLYRVA